MTQLPLLFIEDIFVKDSVGRTEKRCFYLKTKNKSYKIECKSNLDRNVWIKSLIHFTNLAKERNKIHSLNKQIERVQCLKFEQMTKHTLLDIKATILDMERVKADLKVLKEHGAEFLEKKEQAKPICKFLWDISQIFNKIVRKDPEDDEKELYGELEQLLLKDERCGMLNQFEQYGWNESNLSNLKLLVDQNIREGEVEIEIKKIVDDIFQIIKRITVSNSFFVRELGKKKTQMMTKNFKKMMI